MEYIKPELLILIPVLNGVGFALKKAGLRTKFIPGIIILAGASLATLYMFAFVPGETPVQAVFIGIVQGVLLSAAATGVHQNIKLFKTFGEDEKEDKPKEEKPPKEG